MKKILLCLDPDTQPSVFDSVVAIDAGVDHLLRHGSVKPADVSNLLHGAMFTRSREGLASTAVFIGGSDSVAAEQLLSAARQVFFGQVRVSIMLDPSGANTTAAAAVVTAARHISLGPETTAVVLGGTGPVGQRVVRMLAQEGAEVRVASRKMSRAEGVCHRVSQAVSGARVTPHVVEDSSPEQVMQGAHLLISAGAAGVEMLSDSCRLGQPMLSVAIDLNAVPPAGIGGIAPQDKASKQGGQVCYGALGVGGLKMKLHRSAIQNLFGTNDTVLDADEIYALAKEMEQTPN